MNWRKFVLLGCVVACVFAAPIATAQMTGRVFDVPVNARRFDATFDCPNADAPRSDARFDGTDANAPRSNDEFSLGPSTL